MNRIEIDGEEYFSAAELITSLGIARQTLWRWRRQGKIPAGHRYRDRNLIFTSAEAEKIRQFANRVEDIEQPNATQLELFPNEKR
jgi:hypothetical protein